MAHIVTNLEDSGADSLRQVIEEANLQLGKDEIVFQDSLSSGEIALTNSAIKIIDSIDIIGLCTKQLTVRLRSNLSDSNFYELFWLADGTENVIDVEIFLFSLLDRGFFFNRSPIFTSAVTHTENLAVRNSIISRSSNIGIGNSEIIVSKTNNNAELISVSSIISDRGLKIARERDVSIDDAVLDILISGGTSDSFVVASEYDIDKIIDFEPRRNKLLLSEEPIFGDLTLFRNKENVDIVLAEINELLAMPIDTNIKNVREANLIYA